MTSLGRSERMRVVQSALFATTMIAVIPMAAAGVHAAPQ